VSGNTGLLTAFCDPYGAESDVRLMGGVFPESWRGRHMWYCRQRAVARYVMTCTGGEYGTRVAPDGGPVAAYICAGGHKGQPMPLCADHRRMIARRQSDLCPACVWPPRARLLQQESDRLQMSMAGFAARADNLGAYRAMLALEDIVSEFNEMMTRGLVHKCPLRLIEVS
jgi:hypothetical protein